MKICPVNITNKFDYPGKVYSKKYEENQNGINTNFMSPLKADEVSFSGMWDPRVNILRKLLYYRIPDLYSDVILIPPESLKVSLSRENFSGDIKSAVSVLRANKESLFPIDAQLFELLKEQIRKSPNMDLDTFIKSILPEHHTRLLKAQEDVFHNMDSYATALPADLLEQYNYLLYITNKKLNNRPIFLPFEVKEFKYKLGKIKDRINSSGNEEEIKAMQRLIALSNQFPDVSKEVRMEKKFNKKKYEEKQKRAIQVFGNYLKNSVLKKDKDICALVEMAEHRINKYPTRIPFGRKQFIEEVKAITSLLEDRKLAHAIELEATSLPTSKQDFSALVVKEASRSSEQIVFDLLSGSIGSVDHFVASHKGGKESLYNYALTSAYMNEMKAHTAFKVFLRRHPEIAKTAQRQVNRLRTLSNTGVFDKLDLDEYYIENLANKINDFASEQIIKG